MLQAAARDVADRLGKAVRIAVDDLSRPRRPMIYVWLQFVDAEVTIGDPCPCGGTELVRSHPAYATCEACGRLLGLRPPKDVVDLSRFPHLTALDSRELTSPEEIEQAERLAGAADPTELAAGLKERREWEKRKLRRQRDKRRRAKSKAGDAGSTERQAAKDAGRRQADELGDAWSAALGDPGPWPRPFDETLDIDDLVDPVFTASERRQVTEVYFGYARDDPRGEVWLVVVEYPVVEGRRVASAQGHGHMVRRFPVTGFEDLIEIASEPGPAAPGPWPRPYRRSQKERDRNLGHRMDLAAWSDVEVRARESLPGRERRYATGRGADGSLVLIVIDVAVVDGQPVMDADGTGELHAVMVWPLEAFGGMVRL